MARKFVYLALIVLIQTLVEVVLLYFMKKNGGLGFKLSFRPDFELN